MAPKSDKHAHLLVEGQDDQHVNRYTTIHRPKALIHSWLAWQNPPGRPMGQSITSHVLDHHTPLANRFITWMQNLFT